MTKISILMPVYNGLPHIREAIQSVIGQDYQDWELIISDNGSVDGTREFIAGIDDSRVRVIMQPNNLGIFGNLNYLLAEAKSEIAKVLCADDALLEGALSRIMEFMEQRPFCAISRCLAAGELKARDSLELKLPEQLNGKAAALVFATFGNVVGNLSKAACRPAMVIAEGAFSQAYPYAGDYEGWARISRRYGICLQNEELVFERRHEMQSSNLLNRHNELYPQQNKILSEIATHLNATDLPLIRRHWTRHFFSQRTARFAQQLQAGRIAMAFSLWKELPLKARPLPAMLAYTFGKFKVPLPDRTTPQLFKMILERNETLGSSTA